MTTQLDEADGYFVVINMFSVEPERADDLLKVLSDATEEDVSKRAGFVSANFHVSKDRKFVTNYAQWRSEADLNAMMADPKGRESLAAAGRIATKVDPVFYDLIRTY